jgi:hypothetical protein
MTWLVPVMYLARGDARNVTSSVTSSADPTRPSGMSKLEANPVSGSGDVSVVLVCELLQTSPQSGGLYDAGGDKIDANTGEGEASADQVTDDGVAVVEQHDAGAAGVTGNRHHRGTDSVRV